MSFHSGRIILRFHPSSLAWRLRATAPVVPPSTSYFQSQFYGRTPGAEVGKAAEAEDICEAEFDLLYLQLGGKKNRTS